MANLVENPLPIFTDANGDPLEDGYVFIGIAGLSPINNPLQAYWDAALTIPANDIRTKGGYPANSGTPGRLYTVANYSILVQDVRGATLYTNLDSVDYINSASGSLIALVDTIADLRGLALASPDDQASVGGSVTVGDGLMGPLYYWNATSPAVDNGVSIIKPTATVGNGRWLWINTNAPMETVNISSSTTVTLEFKNRMFLVDTALETTVTVPDGDFQGQNIQLANRGVNNLIIAGTGITAGTTVTESILLTWLGTQWSLTFRGEVDITGDLSISGNFSAVGSGSIGTDLSVGGELTVDIINEQTALSGVTINSALIATRKSGTWSQKGNAFALGATDRVTVTRMNTLATQDIAFFDVTNLELRMYRFDGTDWALVGSALSLPGVNFPTMAALNDTDIAFYDALLDLIRTYRFDGANWAQLGNTLSMTDGGGPKLIALSSTRIVIGLQGGTTDLKAFDFDGTDWTATGTPLATSANGVTAMYALNETDFVYLNDAANEFRVYRFDGSVFTEIYKQLVTTYAGLIAITPLNKTDFAFVYTTPAQNITMFRVTEYGFVEIGTASLSLSGITGSSWEGLTSISDKEVAIADVNNELITYEVDYTEQALPPYFPVV